MPKTISNGVKRRLYWRASAIALIATAGLAGAANAQDAGGFWLQFAGGINFDSGGGLDSLPASSFIGGVAGDQKIKPRDDWDVDAKIGYQPHGSPWSVALGVKYGRTFGRSRDFSGTSAYGYYGVKTHASTNVSHAIVDFEVGRDVGMGRNPTTIGLGVRYAHFAGNTTGTFSTFYKSFDGDTFDTYSGALQISRRTNVVGPRIFVNSSVPIATSHFAVGWGGDAAVLFGNTSIDGRAVFSDGYVEFSGRRSESITVPNVGAHLSLDYHLPSTPALISLGYRIDAYFGAMDGGGDVERKVDIIQHGPYLSMIWRLQ
ncbi:MAG TPA: hypothetical protein VG227_09725 [Caulobacteraceae bacterium]|jgi:hypothetical protein|nr:hypothetical protein [Caulobacteraceae bacterium]